MSFILMRLTLQQMLFPHSREGSSNAIKKKKKKRSPIKFLNASMPLRLYKTRALKIEGPTTRSRVI